LRLRLRRRPAHLHRRVRRTGIGLLWGRSRWIRLLCWRSTRLLGWRRTWRLPGCCLLPHGRIWIRPRLRRYTWFPARQRLQGRPRIALRRIVHVIHLAVAITKGRANTLLLLRVLIIGIRKLHTKCGNKRILGATVAWLSLVTLHILTRLVIQVRRKPTLRTSNYGTAHLGWH